MNKDNFEYCIIDADSIVYQIAHMEPSPNLCKKKFDTYIENIISNTDALNSYVFIKGEINFRTEWVSYKANRKDNIDPAVKERIVKLYDHARTYCIEGDGGEADDYVSFTAKGCRNKNLSYIVAHIDKDLNCIPGWHFNFRTGEANFLTNEEAYRFMMMQVLQGDATDNIKGIKGMGSKTAEKLLKDIPPADILKEVYKIWENKAGRYWHDAYVECANLIYMRETPDDLRPLTFEELEERFTWITDTGSPYQKDPRTLLDSSTQSSDQPDDSTSEESSS